MRAVAATLTAALAVTAVPPGQAWAQPTATTSAHLGLLAPGQLDVATLSIPSDLGQIVETWQPSDRAPAGFVLHIQDLHTHPQTQQQIAALIGHLRDRFGIALVAHEGAGGLCDTTLYSDLPDPPSTERVAKLFLQEGLFTGAEYYAITHPGRVRLWGVEDQQAYLDHLRTYQDGLATQRQALAIMDRLRAAIEPLRAAQYPKALQPWARLRASYQTGEALFGPYFREVQELARRAKITLKPYPHLRAAAKAYELQPQLDVREVERERQRLVQDVWPHLPPEQQQLLLAAYEAVGRQQLSTEFYYQVLLELAGAQGLLGPSGRHRPRGPQPVVRRLNALMTWAVNPPPRSYRTLRQYVMYLRLSARLRSGQVADELDALEEDIERAYLTTEPQRALARLAQQTSLLDDLLRTQLSRHRWQRYQAQREQLTPERLLEAIHLCSPQSPVTSEELRVSMVKL